MANISLTLYTNGFIGSVLMSPIQMGSLRVNNSVTNISRLGTFKKSTAISKGYNVGLRYIKIATGKEIPRDIEGQWERDRIERQLEIETPSYTACVQNVSVYLLLIILYMYRILIDRNQTGTVNWRHTLSCLLCLIHH